MEREALQKKLNIYLIQYLISIFIVLSLIIGGSIFMEKENTVLGVTLLSLA